MRDSTLRSPWVPGKPEDPWQRTVVGAGWEWDHTAVEFHAKETEMSETSPIMQRFYKEIFEGGNLALIDELVADDFVDHEEPLPGQPPGKEGVAFFVKALRAAFPDIKTKLEPPALIDGNLEAVYVVCTGTHQGDFAGIPATGRSIEFGGIDIIRFEDGKAAEHWGVTDTLKLMQQLGAVPE